jgi:hypothetical protein
MTGMVQFRLKERAYFVVEMVHCYLRFLQRQPWRLGIGAHPWLMRSRIKSEFLNRFADFAFHGFCSPR